MKRITPTQVFRNRIAPLPRSGQIRTAFRDTYSFSLPVELIDLLKQLNKRVNLSREMEIPIRKAAVKIARKLNEKAPKVRGLLIIQ